MFGSATNLHLDLDSNILPCISVRQMWYCLSKTLAERAALAFADKADMDVVTVCPPLVLGPLLQSTVNTSSLRLLTYLKGITLLQFSL